MITMMNQGRTGGMRGRVYGCDPNVYRSTHCPMTAHLLPSNCPLTHSLTHSLWGFSHKHTHTGGVLVVTPGGQNLQTPPPPRPPPGVHVVTWACPQVCFQTTHLHSPQDGRLLPAHLPKTSQPSPRICSPTPAPTRQAGELLQCIWYLSFKVDCPV